jgi:hypothetical protein
VPQANKKLFEPNAKFQLMVNAQGEFFCLALFSFMKAHFIESLDFWLLFINGKVTKKNFETQINH